MNEVIKIENLKKSYGDIQAVNNISLSVEQGEMFGLVGPDGAGKTTTIRILCGLLKPDSGSVEVLDSDLKKKKKEIQNQIGYLSQKFSLYGDLSVDENIEFFADIHNVKDFQSRRDELLAFTRLTPFRDRLAENLSGGMKQKLALACSLIHKPKIIFLDDEAERCNRVALMNKGKIIAVDTPQNIKSSINKQVIEIITDNIKKTYSLLKEKFGTDAQIFGDRINLVTDDDKSTIDDIKAMLQKNNLTLINYRTITPSLENVFIHLVKKASYVLQ
ncbi:MAG: ABC transporter ATP-binding protein [Ignavibacteriaceae bacterium]